MGDKCRIRACDNEADAGGFCTNHFRELDEIYMEDDARRPFG
jgi:hypothetical protein